MNKFYKVIVSGGYGSESAIYELVDGVLRIRWDITFDKCQKDTNLAGLDLCRSVDKMSLSKANTYLHKNIETMRCKQDRCGCHLCALGFDIQELDSLQINADYPEPYDYDYA